jgi:integrase
MGRKSIENQMKANLYDKLSFGQSKHAAKIERIAEGTYHFKEGLEGVYSYGTATKYMQVITEYNMFLPKKGVSKYAKLSDTQIYAIQYLSESLNAGYSLYTLKCERSALNKIYGVTIEFELNDRNTMQITRSRGCVSNDKHFSEERNRDLVTIAKACGTRRDHLKRIRCSDFFYRKDNLYVNIRNSKGGRDRIALVLPYLQKEVEVILKRKREQGRDKLFTKIHSAMDVHNYRREYAKELYSIVNHDRNIREKALTMYPIRNENVKSNKYRSRKTSEEFHRDSCYIVSKCLGHNRLSVSVNFYLI